MKTKIVILFILISNSLSAQYKDSNYTKLQIENDLKVLKTAITEAHPGYKRFSNDFDSLFNEVYNHLPEKITMYDFYKQTNAIVASLQCGHTKFHPSFDYFSSYPFFFNDQNVLPFTVDIRANKVTVINSNDQAQIPVGAQILKINNKPITSILSVLYKTQFADGNVESSKEREVADEFSARYSNLIENPTNYTIEYQYNNTTFTVTTKGINNDAWNKLKEESPSILKANNSLSFPHDSIAYLRMADFYSSKKGIRKFIDSTFQIIENKNIHHLIIDIRGNQGGYDKLGAYLFSKIALKNFAYYDRIEVKAENKKQFSFLPYASFPKIIGLMPLFIKKKENKFVWTRHDNFGIQKAAKNNYTYKTYFLMDGLSYSSAAEFLSVAKSENRGLFFGEEAGGAYSGNNSGTFSFVNLPNTKMVLAMPLGGYYMHVNPIQDGSRGVLPDYKITMSSKDLLDHKDTVLEKVINQIKQ